jgi:hypothetical protein
MQNNPFVSFALRGTRRLRGLDKVRVGSQVRTLPNRLSRRKFCIMQRHRRESPFPPLLPMLVELLTLDCVYFTNGYSQYLRVVDATGRCARQRTFSGFTHVPMVHAHSKSSWRALEQASV